MIIDASNLILGRMATFVSKKALLGEPVIILNSEKALISGDKKEVIKRNYTRYKRGTFKGPIISRNPDRFIRRTIRGMLPYKQPKGKEAFKRIMCYIGIPDEFKNQKMETIPQANISKLQNLKYISVGEVCKSLGGKI
jgi:large subunit ribosomal protein L13